MDYNPERTILVDFDGTLTRFNWPDPPSEPFPGAPEALRRLKRAGFTIVIFTARAWKGWEDLHGTDFYTGQIDQMVSWLEEYRIPYDGITNEKRPALWTIDDRTLLVGAPLPVLTSRPGPEWWGGVARFILETAGKTDDYGKRRVGDNGEG